MNKFHVVLLSVLAPVVLNAGISEATQGKLMILGTDAVTYNYALDLVGSAKSGGNFITPACIKNRLHVPACITNITNKLPNAVNSENANRILTTGLVYGLSKCCKFSHDSARQQIEATVSYETLHIKDGAKVAVNGMKDATVAIAAVEVLSAVAHKLGGERAEQIEENYASLIESAKAICYSVARHVSKAYTWEVCNTAVKK